MNRTSEAEKVAAGLVFFFGFAVLGFAVLGFAVLGFALGFAVLGFAPRLTCALCCRPGS
jgi:uncharacterized membrane protein required for colicin V production